MQVSAEVQSETFAFDFDFLYSFHKFNFVSAVTAAIICMYSLVSFFLSFSFYMQNVCTILVYLIPPICLFVEKRLLYNENIGNCIHICICNKHDLNIDVSLLFGSSSSFGTIEKKVFDILKNLNASVYILFFFVRTNLNCISKKKMWY